MFKSQRRSYRQELWENSLLFPQSRKLISSFSHAFFFFEFVHTLFGAQDLRIRSWEKGGAKGTLRWFFFPQSSFFNLPATLKMLYNFSVALPSSLFAAYLSCQFQPFFCRIDYRSYEFSSTMLFSRWVPVEREDVASRYRVPKEPCTARTKGRFLWSSKILTTSWNACYSFNS